MVYIDRRDAQMNSDKVQKENESPLHPKGIREHSDGREFHPFALLGAILAVAAVIAIISYGVQLYFIGPG